MNRLSASRSDTSKALVFQSSEASCAAMRAIMRVSAAGVWAGNRPMATSGLPSPFVSPIGLSTPSVTMMLPAEGVYW